MTTLDPNVDVIYVQNSNPSSAYGNAIESVTPGINQVISDQQQQGETWMDTLARSLPILAATYQQKQILSVQVERARQGLPPLDASQFAAGVQVGLTPDVKNILIMGGIGLVAVMVLLRR